MTYELEFHEKALKEFRDLPPRVRERFKSKLKERLECPCVPKAKLAGHPSRYKIKLKKPPLRLVYEVVDARVVRVIVIAKRERNLVYKLAEKRE